jgi:hypothetical protein
MAATGRGGRRLSWAEDAKIAMTEFVMMGVAVGETP